MRAHALLKRKVLRENDSPRRIRVDWDFMARNLAKHLCAVVDANAAERVLTQAMTDATSLDAPIDFWGRVAAAYESAARRAGRALSQLIVESLRRYDETAHCVSGRRS